MNSMSTMLGPSLRAKSAATEEKNEFHEYDTVYLVTDNRDLVAGSLSDLPGLAYWLGCRLVEGKDQVRRLPLRAHTPPGLAPTSLTSASTCFPTPTLP